MQSWSVRMRALPLRAKVLVTVAGGALALLGLFTYLSFNYWKDEALAAAEQQALLAADAVRAPVEASLAAGRNAQARRSLRALEEKGSIARGRVYSSDGVVLLSSRPAEEGSLPGAVWLPRSTLLPAEGVARRDPARETVEAFLPLAGGRLLQVTFPVGPVVDAMTRGLWAGLALVLASVLGMAALLFTMLEHEVVEPVLRVAGLLDGESGDGRRPGRSELGSLEASVIHLIEKERAVEALAEDRRLQIAAQAGLAEVGEMAAEMAHEFKRPLASIRAALEMMGQEYALDPGGERLMGAVQGQLEKLSETMSDLFALAKPVEVALHPTDLREVVDGALLQLSGHPALRGVEVRREYAEAPAPVCGDARRLEQVVLNLLLNAAEAMPGGGLAVVRVAGDAGTVRLEVEDTGVGIPPDQMEKVFRPFHSTKPAGTGLGLALVARIVAAHQGVLQLQSEPGRGTTARVELPAAPHPHDRRAQEAAWLTHASS